MHSLYLYAFRHKLSLTTNKVAKLIWCLNCFGVLPSEGTSKRLNFRGRSIYKRPTSRRNSNLQGCNNLVPCKSAQRRCPFCGPDVIKMRVEVDWLDLPPRGRGSQPGRNRNLRMGFRTVLEIACTEVEFGIEEGEVSAQSPWCFGHHFAQKRIQIFKYGSDCYPL